ncbi:hypothetical protein GCM10008902_14370 [[Clostridium] innocuum]
MQGLVFYTKILIDKEKRECRSKLVIFYAFLSLYCDNIKTYACIFIIHVYCIQVSFIGTGTD